MKISELIFSFCLVLALLVSGCGDGSIKLRGEPGEEAMYLSGRFYLEYGRLPADVDELKQFCRDNNIDIDFDSYISVIWEKNADGYLMKLARGSPIRGMYNDEGLYVEITVSQDQFSKLIDPLYFKEYEKILTE